MVSFRAQNLTAAVTGLIFLTLNPLVSAYHHQAAPNAINRWIRAANPNDAAALDVTFGNATFEQPIDHKNPELGNFSQFYYWSDEFYKGPGSPVILFTPGEANVTGYNTYLGVNRTTGVIAQEIGAAVIVIEHRYWGVSSPYANLSTKNLQYLTLENSIADLVNFAKNAELPFDLSGSSQAAKAPWVLVGGSYSGALSAWVESTSPGTFWAYYASSAPVNSMDYWEYFVPVQEGMPRNCSVDITRVVDHIDFVGKNGSSEDKKKLQAIFGLAELEHYDDFASYVISLMLFSFHLKSDLRIVLLKMGLGCGKATNSMPIQDFSPFVILWRMRTHLTPLFLDQMVWGWRRHLLDTASG
jgi:hypothetical protein